MYYGQLELDKDINDMFFKNRRNGFFVEAGAYDGLDISTCRFFEETLGWTGINIEPVPYIFEKLVVNRPNCINVACALSNVDGKTTFSQPIHPVYGKFNNNGSLKHTEEHRAELNNIKCSMEYFEVETKRFDTLIKSYNIPPIDLFVLDVEGFEVPVLEGIITIPKHLLPMVFCIENGWSGVENIQKILGSSYSYVHQQKHNAFFLKNDIKT